jgi:hypothetical protein
MSKVVKGAGKVFKKIGSAIGKVFNGIKKAFKKVWNSKFGKLFLIAAAIFAGGVALGWINGPSWLGGAGATTGKAATTAGKVAATGAEAGSGIATTATSGVTAAEGAAAGAAAEGAAVGGAAAEGAAVGAGAGGGTVNGVAVAESVGAVNPGYVANAPGTFAGAEGAAGIVNTVKALGKASFELAKVGGKGVFSWAQANPHLAAPLASGVASAFSKSEAEEYYDQQRKDYRRAFGPGFDDIETVRGSGNNTLRDSDGNRVYQRGGGLVETARRMDRPSRNRFDPQNGGGRG